MSRGTRQSQLKDAAATAGALVSLGLTEARAIASGLLEEARSRFARGLCGAVLALVWERRGRSSALRREMRTPICPPSAKYPGLVRRLGEAFAALSPAESGFLIGQLYTALLPDGVRKALGAFYTPPPLVDRLLGLAALEGFDWGNGRILDPACGGAAFLASVAPLLVKSSTQTRPAAVLEDVEARLLGIEVDPFAAWMSMVLLDLTLFDLTEAAGRPLTPIVVAPGGGSTSKTCASCWPPKRHCAGSTSLRIPRESLKESFRRQCWLYSGGKPQAQARGSQ